MSAVAQQVSRSLWLCIVLSIASACQSTQTESPVRQELPMVRVAGNLSLSSEPLKKIVRSELRAALGIVRSRAAVDDSAYALAQHYRALGFPDVQVSYDWSEPSAEHPEGFARFQISEGRRLLVGEFLFRGNQAIGAKTLTALYDGKRAGVLGSGRPVYDESQANSFAHAIADLYFERGFLDVRVPAPTTTWSADGKLATLLYEIDEGPLYQLRSVRITGVEPDQEAKLLALTSRFTDKPFVPSVLYEVRGRLVESLGEEGYPNVTVEGVRESGESPGDVKLHFDVETGESIRIREIEVRGNERTRLNTIRKLLALREGERYRYSAQRESFEALFGSGLFESVRLSLTDQQDGEATWLVEVVEASTSELFVEPGYGSYEGFRLRGGVRERNLFGLGHLGRAEVTVGFIAQQAEVGYTNPRFQDSLLELDVSAYWARREEPSFLRKEAGVGATLTRRFDENFRTSLGYRFRNSQATEVEVLDPPTLAALETVNISSITLSPTYDSRIGVFAPTGGALARLILEYAGVALGSEIDFCRVRAHWAIFEPLREGTVLAGAFRSGVIVPVGTTNEIPLQERFFNGGEISVRSFHQDELGARDAGGNPIGGEAFTTISAELRQEVIGSIQVAAFAETGNLVPDAADYFDFEGFRHALGVGVRYLLPIGPLRLDWGWNPNPQGQEEDWVLHLSVGMAF